MAVRGTDELIPVTPLLRLRPGDRDAEPHRLDHPRELRRRYEHLARGRAGRHREPGAEEILYFARPTAARAPGGLRLRRDAVWRAVRAPHFNAHGDRHH